MGWRWGVMIYFAMTQQLIVQLLMCAMLHTMYLTAAHIIYLRLCVCVGGGGERGHVCARARVCVCVCVCGGGGGGLYVFMYF